MRSGRNASAILDALGDPTRRVIYERLRRGPASVGALAQGLPVTRSAVSRHLAVLRACGLVTSQAEGVRRIYSATEAGLRPLSTWIAGRPSP